MKCNNKYCYWQVYGQCCHESEAEIKNATPNMLDCPSSLRKDLEKVMAEMVGIIGKPGYNMTFNQMIEHLKQEDK